MEAVDIDLEVLTFEAKTAMKNESFYTDAKDYWEKIPSTVDGMLGGFGSISGTEIAGSIEFLKPFLTAPWPERVQSTRALDCGAGIGRITKHLLLPLFQNVDLVDQNPNFVESAKEYIGKESERVEKFITKGLQNFTPQPVHYDVIWIQWVIGHLNDDHFVHFLKRCKTGLTENGIICIKDNIAKEGVVLDDQDSSVTRSIKELKRLIKAAGLTILKQKTQKKLPLEIFRVEMFAMR